MSRLLRRGIYSVPLSRFFTTLAAAGSQYFTVPAITLSGDFEIELEFSTTVMTNQILLGDDNSTSYYFNMTSMNFVVWFAGTSVSFSHGIYEPQDGKLHNIKYVLSGTSLELFLDGNSLGSQTITPYTGVNNFLIAGANSSSVTVTGTVANVKITDSGTLVRDYPIDEKWIKSNALINKVAASSPEQLTNPNFDTDLSSWTHTPSSASWEAGTLKFVSDTAGGYPFVCYQAVSQTQQQSYVLSFKVNDIFGDGDFTIIILPSGGGVRPLQEVLTSAGVCVYTFTYDPTQGDGLGFDVYFESSLPAIGDTLILDYVHLEETTSGEAINITDADAERYRLYKNVNPHEWRNSDASEIIPVAGT